jgi:energy-converting hydrogenase Eha subunit C
MHWPSILLYMTSSFMIVIFNKIILTGFQFPSIPFLMFCQSIVSSLFFWFKLKQRPNHKIIVVCLLNVGNVFFGLSAAGNLNIAMFTALRRISILMTLIAQWWILKKTSTKPIVTSVAVMVLGSFVAAADDLTFDAKGYTFAMMNNLLTAASQIASKYAFDDGWDKETLLFCSSVASIVISGMSSFKFEDFDAWNNVTFQIALGASVVLGILLNYGASWVIEKNDALTLAVAGSTKSALMGLLVCFGLFDPTYKFTWVNFVGLQISACASFFYVYFAKKTPNSYEPVSQNEVQGDMEQGDMDKKTGI